MRRVLSVSRASNSSLESLSRSVGASTPAVKSPPVPQARPLLSKRSVVTIILLLFFITALVYVVGAINSKRFRLEPCVIADQAPTFANAGLPKIIHQQWPKNGAMPQVMESWFRKWDELFPHFEHRLWTDEDIRDLIANDFPWFLATFDSYPFNIMRVDAARYFILFKYGGLYADMDYEPLVNFWDRLPDDRPALIESPWNYEVYQNSFMSSPPRHELWNVTWTVLIERANAGSELVKTAEMTGPMALDEAVARYHKTTVGARVLPLPCINWHRVSLGHQKNTKMVIERLWGYYTKNLFKSCGSTTDARCQFGVHHSRTMWGE